MKGRIQPATRAERREIKKRPRMHVSGAALRKRGKFAAMRLVKKARGAS